MVLKSYKLKCIIILVQSKATQTMALIIYYLFVNDKTKNNWETEQNIKIWNFMHTILM